MKICLAGTGAMGEIHAKALAKIEDVQIVSIAGRTEESAKGFAEKWKIPFGSSNLEACIEQPGVDAVILTTPSEQHCDQTLLALSRGKHVQVEIPMALSLSDSQKMLDASRKAGRTLMITHTRRFASPHREIRRRIQDGTFHLQHMVVETYFFRRTNLNMHGQPRSWVDNLLWHHAAHSVDLAQWVLGEPNWTAWGQKGPEHKELHIPMDVSVAMKTKTGPIFTMAMSFNNQGPFGTSKAPFGASYRYIGEEDTFQVFRDTMTDSKGNEVALDQTPAFDRQDVEFVSAIREGREPESSAASVLPTMALLDQVERAMNK